MKRVFSFLALALVLGVFSTSSAFAAIDLTEFVIDMGPVEAIAGILLGALAVLFGINKVLGLARRR